MTATDPTTLRTTWPGLDEVPSGPRTAVSAAVARRLFHEAMRMANVGVIEGPDVPVAADRPTIVLHQPEEFYRRTGRDRLIGFGESYLTGAWDSPDLPALLTRLAGYLPTLIPGWLQRFRGVFGARELRSERATMENAQSNIAHHYDLSNELFATFLDPSMTYSAALFDDPDPTTESLQTAQHRKIDRMLDSLGVGPGSRLLEIGTGWGELALRAAHRGARVRTVTLSVEQRDLARERIAAAGHGDAVSVELLDYREVREPEGFDAVASVEMIEAVGADYWPEYFGTIDDLLAPGGRACIQAITMPHDRMLATRGGRTWVNKYIFPGGFLPSVEAIDEVTRRHTRLRVVDRHLFGMDYAETLRRWDESFMARREQVLGLGFDEVFVRMWHFYLVYSRAGFASGYLDVGQFTLARPTDREVPDKRYAV